LWIFFSPSK